MNEWIREREVLKAEIAALREENRTLRARYAAAVAEIDRIAAERSKLHERIQSMLVRLERSCRRE